MTTKTTILQHRFNFFSYKWCAARTRATLLLSIAVLSFASCYGAPNYEAEEDTILCHKRCKEDYKTSLDTCKEEKDLAMTECNREVDDRDKRRCIKDSNNISLHCEAGSKEERKDCDAACSTLPIPEEPYKAPKVTDDH